MKFTLNWLKRHLKTEASVDAIVNKLNQLGLEVEGVIDSGAIYKGFVVAEIIDANKHRDSDRLTVCQVDTGKEVLQIVCGAPNARSGIKVILAQVGAVIPANGLVIKKSTIRGVESNGMLCSYEELQLPGSGDGIVELTDGVIGTSAADFFGINDTIIEVAITPNRGDCAGVYGIARDLAAAGIGKLLSDTVNAVQTNNTKLPIDAAIQAKSKCREILFCYGKNLLHTISVDNTYVKLLNNIGYTSKNALVDISNYVMFDTGRPNHIYDADKIVGGVVVRNSHADEKFVAIGGVEYLLPEGLLVIADQDKILSVAGVIGGETSKVTDATKNILIEVADFDADTVMKSGRALGIVTDSRFRFERNVDHDSGMRSINSIISLIVEKCGGEFFNIISVRGDSPIPSGIIDFDPQHVEKIAGISIEREAVFASLEKLGFIKLNDTNAGNIKVPSWRVFDVVGAADLVEEVLRIYGLENIPLQDLPYVPMRKCSHDYNNKIRDRLLNRNLTEVISWSFTSNEIARVFALDDLLILRNPIASSMDVMRPSMICSFIPVLQKNIARGTHNIGMFEIGSVYSLSYDINQTMVVSGLRSGLVEEKSVHCSSRAVDFFDVKDDVLSVLSEFNIDLSRYAVTRDVPTYYHPTRSAVFKLGKNIAAFCGELHPRIVDMLKIDSSAVYGFEIFLDNIPKTKIAHKQQQLFDYQSINRDFSFVVQRDLPVAEIIRSVHSLKIDLLDEIKIFDVYEGESIDDNLKSVGLTVRIQPKTATLTEAEIDAIAQRIVQRLATAHDAYLRH